MKVKYLLLDKDTLEAEMARRGRASVLIVGNHVGPNPIVPLDSEFVIAFADNHLYNKIPDDRVDMVAGTTLTPTERVPPDIPHLWTIMYPCGMDAFEAIQRDRVYTIDNLTLKYINDSIGILHYVFPPQATAGFSAVVALERIKIKTRVAGFSFYQAEGEERRLELAHGVHFPEREREHIRKLIDNPLFTFTPECLKYLNKGV